MTDSKECLICFSEIDARARRCPKCDSKQSKFAQLESRAFSYPFLLPLLILGYLAYDTYTSNSEDKAFQLVSVSVFSLSIPQENNMPHYASCLGAANNKSEYDFGDMTFQAFFFSADGSLIDTFQIKDEDTIFLANKVTNFRVRNLAQEPPVLYESCTLEMVSYGWAL